MNKPFDHSFRGVKYRVLFRQPKGYTAKIGGACSSPASPNPTIEVSPKARGANKLRILVDESIHAVLWDLDNDSVGQCSDAIAEFLWKCGLRFMEEGQD